MRCLNGTPHEHETVAQSKLCWARRYRTPQSPVTENLTNRSGSLSVTQPSKLELVLPLLEAVPDGYFAVQMDANAKMQFVRISTVKRKDAIQNGWRRIQTIHGPTLDLKVAISPTGKVREYGSDITDTVLLIISDYQAATLRYAKEIGKCGRCNTRLTSDWRLVGIGPECVKHWPWAIERAAEGSS